MGKPVNYGMTRGWTPNRAAGRRDKTFRHGLQAEQKRQAKAIAVKKYMDEMGAEVRYETGTQL